MLYALQKKLARDERKKAQEQKKNKLKEENLIKTIEERGITLGTNDLKHSSSISLSDLEPHHPAAHVSFLSKNLLDSFKFNVFNFFRI